MILNKNSANMISDLSWYEGLQNTGKDAEVYLPQSDPNGLIEIKLSRSKFSAKF